MKNGNPKSKQGKKNHEVNIRSGERNSCLSTKTSNATSSTEYKVQLLLDQCRDWNQIKNHDYLAG